MCACDTKVGSGIHLRVIIIVRIDVLHFEFHEGPIERIASELTKGKHEIKNQQVLPHI